MQARDLLRLFLALRAELHRVSSIDQPPPVWPVGRQLWYLGDSVVMVRLRAKMAIQQADAGAQGHHCGMIRKELPSGIKISEDHLSVRAIHICRTCLSSQKHSLPFLQLKIPGERGMNSGRRRYPGVLLLRSSRPPVAGSYSTLSSPRGSRMMPSSKFRACDMPCGLSVANFRLCVGILFVCVRTHACARIRARQLQDV